jgi:hypothetical protein
VLLMPVRETDSGHGLLYILVSVASRWRDLSCLEHGWAHGLTLRSV